MHVPPMRMSPIAMVFGVGKQPRRSEWHSILPAKMSKNVVLPAPLGPIIAVIVPGAHTPLTPSRMRFPRAVKDTEANVRDMTVGSGDYSVSFCGVNICRDLSK